jgi:hypothetical protein
MRVPGSIPRGVLTWNWDSPVSNVSLHWWLQRDWSLWPRLRRASSRTITRPSCRQCDNPTWSHTAFLSQIHTCCRSSFWLHNWHSRLLGEALWRACSLITFIHSSTGPVVYLFASHQRDPGSIPRGVCDTGILLLAFSHYTQLFCHGLMMSANICCSLLVWYGQYKYLLLFFQWLTVFGDIYSYFVLVRLWMQLYTVLLSLWDGGCNYLLVLSPCETVDAALYCYFVLVRRWRQLTTVILSLWDSWCKGLHVLDTGEGVCDAPN